MDRQPISQYLTAKDVVAHVLMFATVLAQRRALGQPRQVGRECALRDGRDAPWPAKHSSDWACSWASWRLAS